MSGLVELLTYLERRGVRELILQTDTRPAVRLGDEAKAIARDPLTTGQIEALFSGTGAHELVQSQSAEGTTQFAHLHGKTYALRITRRGNRVQVRLAPAPAAAHAPARPDTPPRAATTLEESTPALELDLAPPARTARANAGLESPRNERAVSFENRRGAGYGLAELLSQARARAASDVHVMANRAAQMRIAGRLAPTGGPLSAEAVEGMLMPLLDDRALSALTDRGYADVGVDLSDAGRLRLNVSRQRTGLKGCFRLVAPAPPTLGELGLPEELSKITLHHQGLVIVSGPSGHGKTTTMAALVNLFSSRPVHVITLEDPVEVIHPASRAVITQREIGRHTESTQTGLKAALREDPDVIAIGELRDRETVEVALSAAETGHLVIATMSTPSGARTIDRLIDMFPPDDQSQVRATLAGALKMVISQRLLPTADERKMVVAAELITGNIPLWSMIRDNKLYQLPSLLQRGRAYGMIRIEDSLSTLVQSGLISLETAKQYADDPRQISANRAPASPPAAASKPSGPGAGGLLGRFGRKN